MGKRRILFIITGLFIGVFYLGFTFGQWVKPISYNCGDNIYLPYLYEGIANDNRTKSM
jgi:hypothetical protein